MRTLLYLLVLLPTVLCAQTDSLPYYQIRQTPADYGPGNVLSRMIDGLGFRYRWATEDLRKDDLALRPTQSARSIRETMEHVYGLATTVYNAATDRVRRKEAGTEALSTGALRLKTLQRLTEAAAAFRGLSAAELSAKRMRFSAEGEGFPVWLLINGPLSDAIYHTGQIVTIRRMNGNPIPAGVNQFRGVKND